METGYLLLLFLLAVINFPFVVGVDWFIRSTGIKRVYSIVPSAEQLQREKRNAFVGAPTHAVLLGLFIWSGALKPGDENLLTLLTTFVITFLWTELWHYTSHIAMHTRRMHFIHAEHHRSMLTNVWTAVSFSLLEKFIFSVGIIGFMSMLSRFMPISVYGIGAYYVFYFFTNTLGHANIEMRKPGYYDSWLGKLVNTSSYHALHHSRYVKNYGLITPWFDKLFGTMWDDVAKVQTRVARGEPLSRLKEKVS